MNLPARAGLDFGQASLFVFSLLGLADTIFNYFWPGNGIHGSEDSPAVATPATYTYKGKQYVVFSVGGNTILDPRVSDQLVAYALPG